MKNSKEKKKERFFTQRQERKGNNLKGWGKGVDKKRMYAFMYLSTILNTEVVTSMGFQQGLTKFDS